MYKSCSTRSQSMVACEIGHGRAPRLALFQTAKWTTIIAGWRAKHRAALLILPRHRAALLIYLATGPHCCAGAWRPQVLPCARTQLCNDIQLWARWDRTRETQTHVLPCARTQLCNDIQLWARWDRTRETQTREHRSAFHAIGPCWNTHPQRHARKSQQLGCGTP
jgi:hypothetical protein